MIFSICQNVEVDRGLMWLSKNGSRCREYEKSVGIIADAVIVELKAVRALVAEHEAQLLNYLKATRYGVGLLLNFGPRPQVKRKVYDNERKGNLSWVENG